MPKKKGHFALQLDIFDFDQTISIARTIGISNEEFDHHHNIKTNLPLSHSDTEKVCAIASYHNNPELIMTYLETHLNKSMKLIRQIPSDHEILSIYEVNGESIPLVISTLPPDNYQAHYRYHEKHGKNRQLKSIYEYLKSSKLVDAKTKYNYYEDSESNIGLARNQFTCFKLKSHLVNKDNPAFEVLENAKKHGNRYRFHQSAKEEKKPSRSRWCLCCYL